MADTTSSGRGVLRLLRHLGTAGVITSLVIAVAVGLFGPGGELEPAAASEVVAAASLDVLEDAVERRAAGTGDFAPAQDNALLDPGDVVRTDETGFAQVDWSDGSLTRLDAGTQLAIVRLEDDALAPSITVRLDVGRAWNRVQKVTGEHGGYEVETAVGTAAVRGTAFSILCTEEGVCTFSVWDGVVALTTPDGGEVLIEAGQTVTIAAADQEQGVPILPPVDPEAEDPDGGEPSTEPDPDEPAPEAAFVEVSRDEGTPDELRAGDPWIDDNLLLDEDTGRFGARREACAASLAGRNAHLANTPRTAIELDADAVEEALGLTIAPLDSYDIRLAILGQEFTAGSGQITGDRQEFRDDVDVSDYAVFGVGLYEVAAVTTGVDCRLDGYVRITGRFPLTTVAGGIGLLLSVLGFALVSAAASTRSVARRVLGRRVGGAVAGAVGGVGLAILVQQFGVAPLTTGLLGGMAAGAAVVGAGLPRPPAGAPAGASVDEPAGGPADAPVEPTPDPEQDG